MEIINLTRAVCCVLLVTLEQNYAREQKKMLIKVHVQLIKASPQRTEI